MMTISIDMYIQCNFHWCSRCFHISTSLTGADIPVICPHPLLLHNNILSVLLPEFNLNNYNDRGFIRYVCNPIRLALQIFPFYYDRFLKNQV